MSDTIERPQELRVNAWTGDSSPEQTLPPRTPWAQVEQFVGRSQWLAPAAPVDPRKWWHPEVGWGLVLPDDDSLVDTAKARGEDAPPAIQKLLQSRPNSPVLRYRKELQQGYLRRYYADGTAKQDLSAQAPVPGIGPGRMPQYLLIYAPPEKIPWAVQYALNMSTFVGRLDLTGAALDHYVSALIKDWADQSADPRAPLVWSSDYGTPDITWLMARAVAGKLWDKYQQDSDLGHRLRLDGDAATGNALAAALSERKPAFVVTTSHGMTGRLDDKTVLDVQLGSPVDVQRTTLRFDQLQDWNPSGAIWYSHACCSAGSDRESRYQGLLPDDGAIATMLKNVAAAAGARTAPLPRALLGAEKPLRAFLGHVEPTFDWTLRDPQNNQVVTHVLQKALYDNIYRQDVRTPIGFALQDVYKEAGAFYGSWQKVVNGINENVPGMRDWALYRQLVAMDRQTLVILGDPTVSLPLFQ
jgi:hypothetical protein